MNNALRRRAEAPVLGHEMESASCREVKSIVHRYSTICDISDLVLTGRLS
jgi:hypothetical protein